MASAANALAPAPTNALPLSYREACRAVAECVRVDECKGWADKAAAVAAYAKMVRNAELEADAKRIRLRATRRIGEIIGANGRLSPVRSSTDPATTLSNNLRRASRSIARIPEGIFENIVQSDNPPGVNLLGTAYVGSSGEGSINKEASRKREIDKVRAHKRGAAFIEKSKTFKPHILLDYLIDRQPARNLEWREVKAWAAKHLHLANALLLLADRFDDERRVGDCVDEADADHALEITRSSK